MKDSTKRALRAFAVAPLAPGLLIWAVGGDHSAIALFGCLVGGGILTYPVTLLVGVPAYLLINRYATLRARHILAISGLAGASMVLLLSNAVTASGVMWCVALGLSAGLTFWLLWRL